MTQGQFTFNGEQYLVDDSTSPPSVFRMSQQGPVQMSPTNPGWNTAEFRQKMNQSLADAAQGRTPAPRNPSAGSGGGSGGFGGFGDYVPPSTDQAAAPSNQSGVRGVGIKPDGTLGWVDAQGNEVNPDGSPVEGAQKLRPLAPAPNTAPGGLQQVISGIPGVGTSATQPIQPTTPPPNAPAPTQAAPAPDQGAVESRILNSIGRSGWKVVGRTDEMKNQSVIEGGVATNKLAPTGNKIWAITGPNGQNDTVTVHDSASTPGDFDVVEPPKNLPPNNQQVTLNGAVYTPNPDDPNGPWVSRAVDPTMQAQAKANVSKTLVDANYTQAQIDALMAKNPAEVQQILASSKLTQAQQQKVLQDMQIAQAKLGGDIAKTGAETGLLGAQTGQVQTATQIAQAKAPAEIEELKARTAQAMAAAGASQASIQKTLQDIEFARAPQTAAVTAGTGAQYIMQTDPATGQVAWVENRNFQPKTRADVASRVSQIQGLAQRKQAEVQAKIKPDGSYSSDDAGKEFNAWWASQVEPQMGPLRAAQEQIAQDQARLNAATRTSALTAANQSNQQALDAIKQYQSMNPIGNKAALESLYAKAGAPAGIVDAITYQAPNPMDYAHQATMEALKYIDPTAAAATGAPPPNYAAMNPPAMLDRTNYQFGAQPPGPPAPAQAPIAPVAAPAPIAATAGPRLPTDDWFAQLMGRQNASVDEQRRQALAMPVPGAPRPPGPPSFIPSTNTWDMTPSYIPFGGQPFQ